MIKKLQNHLKNKNWHFDFCTFWYKNAVTVFLFPTIRIQVRTKDINFILFFLYWGFYLKLERGQSYPSIGA